MTTSPNRRFLLKSFATGAPALLASSSVAAPYHPQEAALVPGSIPVSQLPFHYDVNRDIHNLENGYWGVMPRTIAAEYSRQITMVNRDNSIWARNVLPSGSCLAGGGQEAQAAIARQVGCSPEEIAVTRSGSDALQLLIVNYRLLKAGEAVIYCDLDYDAMIDAMNWLGTHRGAKVVRFAMPEPATTANILQAYHDVLERTPNAKLLLVTQVSNRTGLVTPVKEIVAMARERGVDTVVDVAHGIACLDFKIEDIGADFAGWSVHKWTSAPLGTGAMYIRSSRLEDIDVAYDNHHIPVSKIQARVPAGTINFAAILTIPKAVDFHFAVGAAAKEAHLRALRDGWVDAVADLRNVEICVPADPARYCTITSFRLKGMTTEADALHLQRVLLQKHNVHTVWRGGIAKGPVIRVTPGLYSSPSDIDALVKALQAEHSLFV
ncbi:aminotransferase class V-fold PLP-dependent enzyme [Asaia lannensis]|uniref:Aminotransferase class V-fold PLP-dependent enzyme n=1 Tax=Asaia lannensis NBRC 102526 TaxID=1307926 RepID=A0ABT1CCC7_9PROT|nr:MULTISPECIES: aminotransferase class V-fold PLP-dependent enzyme [Asaia]MCO6158508.1 aminotransferase class V-fold PLP-dependent enzyme [Asaia lannensis NBRC 102526]GBR01005.1 selenocysteine lyase [Asaia lannensis NBRC 102526]